MKSKVAIVKGNNPSNMVERALQLIDPKNLINPDDRVLVKPNYVVAKHPSTGFTTDSQVIESIIKFVKRNGAKDITVGEGGAGSTDRAFDTVGIRAVVERQQVNLVNLNRDPRINVKIPDPLTLTNVDVAETGLQSTCIINVPKLKVHHLATVTLCIKNLMGFILPKSIMHSQIHEKIVDLASIFKDKVKLNVIDGLIGAEVNETSGNPVKMGLIIAGQDMVAVDTVASAVMGFDPENIRYLGLAANRGFGISNLGGIEVLGKAIDDVKKKFRVNVI